MASLKNKAFRRVLYAGAVIAFITIAGGLVFHFVEGLSWLDAFYFAVMTLTTIATITPAHDVTKIFLMFYALIGVASVLYLVTGAASYYLEQRESAFEERIENFTSIVKPPRISAVKRKEAIGLDQQPTLQAAGRKLNKTAKVSLNKLEKDSAQNI